jgi:hypothetical protein
VATRAYVGLTECLAPAQGLFAASSPPLARSACAGTARWRCDFLGTNTEARQFLDCPCHEARREVPLAPGLRGRARRPPAPRLLGDRGGSVQRERLLLRRSGVRALVLFHRGRWPRVGRCLRLRGSRGQIRAARGLRLVGGVGARLAHRAEASGARGSPSRGFDRGPAPEPRSTGSAARFRRLLAPASDPPSEIGAPRPRANRGSGCSRVRSPGLPCSGRPAASSWPLGQALHAANPRTTQDLTTRK